MNKIKRAARRRKRAKETLKIAERLDRHHVYDTQSRLKVHNTMAERGKGDHLTVSEYYSLETYRRQVAIGDFIALRDNGNSKCYW